jgi:enoyl-CoA hydratase/carnithine racemase
MNSDSNAAVFIKDCESRPHEHRGLAEAGIMQYKKIAQVVVRERMQTDMSLVETEAEIEESYACFDTADFQTGYKAFLAKKKPEFEGR